MQSRLDFKGVFMLFETPRNMLDLHLHCEYGSWFVFFFLQKDASHCLDALASCCVYIFMLLETPCNMLKMHLHCVNRASVLSVYVCVFCFFCDRYLLNGNPIKCVPFFRMFNSLRTITCWEMLTTCLCLQRKCDTTKLWKINLTRSCQKRGVVIMFSFKAFFSKQYWLLELFQCIILYYRAPAIFVVRLLFYPVFLLLKIYI